MDFAANFTAIDFETASRRADSACQLAAVRVRDGQIVDQSMWMIRPEPFQFSPQNIQIHGITPQTVQDQPGFGQLWPEIATKLQGDALVAHNAGFDIGVLLACLRAHDQQIPDLQFTCTRAIARRTWPHLPRFGLKPLATWLGIRFRHHDALEDSIACAKILLAAGIDREANSLRELESSLKLTRGQAGPWGYRGPLGRASQHKRRRGQPTASRSTPGRPAAAQKQPTLPFLFPDHFHTSADGSLPPPSSVTAVDAESSATSIPHPEVEPALDLQRLLIRAEFIRPLAGKRVVISGRLKSLNQEQAEMLATRLGGQCQPEISDSTDLLVLGAKDTDQLTADRPAGGKAMEVVSENEFLGLLVAVDSGDAAG